MLTTFDLDEYVYKALTRRSVLRPQGCRPAGSAARVLLRADEPIRHLDTKEMADWQQNAGLQPRQPLRFRTAPGAGAQVAVKPG
jgi:hypothetical protein